MGQSGNWTSADCVSGKQTLRRGQRVDQEPDLTKPGLGRFNASGSFTPVKALVGEDTGVDGSWGICSAGLPSSRTLIAESQPEDSQ
jgi:hypothetical protein